MVLSLCPALWKKVFSPNTIRAGLLRVLTSGARRFSQLTKRWVHSWLLKHSLRRVFQYTKQVENSLHTKPNFPTIPALHYQLMGVLPLEGDDWKTTEEATLKPRAETQVPGLNPGPRTEDRSWTETLYTGSCVLLLPPPYLK